MRPYLTQEHPLRFAHRGSRILWPENTMLAFQGAVGLGYRYIETDVHVTRDGVVVVFHDEHLDRLTNGTGRVADWSWDELRLLDAAYSFAPERGYPERGRGHGVPRLEEALAAFPGVMFNIDLKQPRIEEVVAAFLRDRGFEDRVLIASFFDIRIRRFRRLSRGAVATAAGPAEAAAAMLAARAGRRLQVAADALQLPSRRGGRVVDRRLLTAAHAAGKQVHVWTVNDPEEMSRLLALGVDGIVTDRPDLLNDVLEARSGG